MISIKNNGITTRHKTLQPGAFSHDTGHYYAIIDYYGVERAVISHFYHGPYRITEMFNIRPQAKIGP